MSKPTASSSGTLPSKMGRSEKAIEGYTTAISYINKYLDQAGLAYANLEEVVDAHVEGEHLQLLMENIGVWLANTQFEYKPGTFLSSGVKVTYFKAMKEVWKGKFPRHPLFAPNSSAEWWTDMQARFKKETERGRQLDPSVWEERKSEPLYRDLGKQNTAVRVKFRGNTTPDCKSIAASMVLNIMDMESAGVLAQFNLTRHGVGRGGEHAFLRFGEGAWDPLFDCIDFDWALIKQSDRQCMLMFCDKTIYQLCPYFGLGVYWAFGGLRREGIDDAKKDYVFPALHNCRRDNVAKTMTRQIRKNIVGPDNADAEEAAAWEAAKDRFTSRSTRKGCMTENRVHEDLSLKEEYARSGHTAPEMNPNAEGYVGSTPALSAPGGMAVAGYSNCHGTAVPSSLSSIGEEGWEAMSRMLDILFVNDVPDLQRGKRLRPLLNTAAARVIGAYNQLVSDFTSDHPLVNRIQTAAKAANIEDRSVEPGQSFVPRWKTVLSKWSTRITDAFVESNIERPRQDAPTASAMTSFGAQLERYGRKLDALYAKVDSLAAANATTALSRDNQSVMAVELKTVRDQLEKLEAEAVKKDAECKQLRRALDASLARSPAPAAAPASALAAAAADRTTSPPAKRAKIASAGAAIEDAAASKLTAAAVAAAAGPSAGAAGSDWAANSDAFNGIAYIPPPKIGGIEVKMVLERLHDEGLLKKAKDNAPGGKLPPKRILFDKKQAQFLQWHPSFLVAGEKGRYERGMTVVAMAMEQDQWEQILGDELGGTERRELYHQIQEQSMRKAFALETEVLAMNPERTCGRKAAVGTFADRLQAIKKGWKANGKSPGEIDNIIDRHVGDSGIGGQKQSHMSDFLGKKSN